METDYFIPLRVLFADLLGEDGAPYLDVFQPANERSLIDDVGVNDFKLRETVDQLNLTLNLVYRDELVITFPGFEGFALVFGSVGDRSTVEVEAYLRPPFGVRLVDVNVVLRIREDLIRPVERDVAGNWVPKVGANGAPRPFEIRLTAVDLVVDAEGDIEVTSLDGALGISIDAFMIGESGFVIEADQPIMLHLSRKGAPPAEQSAGWRGVYIPHAAIHLSDFDFSVVPASLEIIDCYIGSGGFTGTVSSTWTPALTTRLLGVESELKRVSLSFVQNTPTESEINGTITLPFFDQPVAVDLGLGLNGELTVALSAAQPDGVIRTDDGLIEFEKPGILRLHVNSLDLEKRGDDFSVRLSGRIKPLFREFDWPEVEVQELLINKDGHIRFEGGWLDLSQQKTLDFHGFALEVSKIGFGTEDDRSRWIGFSGGLKLSAGLPMSGAVEGLRIYWKGSDVWLRFTGAEVAFEIPDSIAFSGRVEFIEDPKEPKDPSAPKKRGFKGGGKLKVIPSGLEINAEVVIGKNELDPSYTFFYIFLDTQLPAGIPLFSTGVSLYGIAGLFAYNMEPNKDPELEWYDGWYKDDPIGVSSSQKWRDERGNFALGAGVTLGTSSDDGYSVNAKTLLVLVLPGPTVLLEGKGAFLKKRTEPSDEPAFRALAVLDGQAGQFLLNMEAKYPTPPDDAVGKLIRVTAGAEAFFDFNDPNNWHLFVGQRDPREKRVRAEILSLFEANAYYMLYPTRFETGVWAGYDRKWQFGPLHVTLQAWIEGNALVSWKPVQMQGDFTLLGEVELRAFGASLGLSLEAGVEVEAPTPYRVFAEFDVKMNLPWPLPNPEAHIELEWKETVLPPTPIPLSTAGIEHLKVTEKWTLNRFPNYDTMDDGLWYPHSTSEPMPSAPEDSPIVPLDAKPVLSFARPMVDAALVGLNPSGVVAPERVGDYEFRYRLVRITQERRAKTSYSESWQTVASRSAEDTDTDKEKLWGAWLAVDGDITTSDSSQSSSMTKLMIFARNPFEYARETIDDTYYDQFSDWHLTYGTCVVNPPSEECFDFDDLLDKKGKEQTFREIRRGDVIIIGDNLRVRPNPTGSENAYLEIGLHTQRSTVMLFPEHVRQIELLIGKNTRATAYLYDSTEKVGQWTVVNSQEASMTFRFPENLIDNFNLLVFNGRVKLFRFCHITAAEADRFKDEKETAYHASDAGDAYSYPPYTELLLPNSYYKLTVVTEALRRRIGEDNWELIKTFEESSYFQTAEPPGIYQPPNEGEMTPTGEEEHYPQRGPLKDLRAYVSKVLPEEGSQAVYRSYDVGVEFNEPYVEHMYLMAGKPLSIYLYDNNGQGLLAPDGKMAATASAWQANTLQTFSRATLEWQATTARSQEVLSTMVEVAGGQAAAEEAGHPAAYSKITNVNLDLVPKQAGVWGGGEDFVLKPHTLYRAAIVVMVPQVVIPLTIAGKPIFLEDELQYAQIAQDGSNFISAVEDNYGQSETGMKVISDGQRIIVTDYKAVEAAQPVTIDREFIDSILKETIEPSAPKQEPKAVFSWSFLTSRFTSFVHHIHSFVDAVWDLRTTLGVDAWPEITQPQRDEMKGLIEAAHPQREEIYRKSIEFFALQDRPLPERFEIQVLKDSNGPYGFLIENPEPIQWRLKGKGRVTLDVRKSEHKMESPVPAYGPVKFIDCNLRDEWVEILVQTDLDLSGYKIERIYEEAPADLYNEFGDNSQYRTGTVIRIHTHSPPPNYSPNVERKDIFLETDADILTNEGEILRISDAEGREIHRRQFAPREFERLQIVIAPDVDGTRTFIFLQGNSGEWISQLQEGTYRFRWTFRRSAGGGLPILRRGGSTAREETTLEFNLPAELP